MGGHLQWTEAVNRAVSITQVGLMASQNRCENIETSFQWHATCTVRQEEHRSFFIRLWFMGCEHERLPHGVRGALSNTLTTLYFPTATDRHGNNLETLGGLECSSYPKTALAFPVDLAYLGWMTESDVGGRHIVNRGSQPTELHW
jgi:hypothetical protein